MDGGVGGGGHVRGAVKSDSRGMKVHHSWRRLGARVWVGRVVCVRGGGGWWDGRGVRVGDGEGEGGGDVCGAVF